MFTRQVLPTWHKKSRKRIKPLQFSTRNAHMPVYYCITYLSVAACLHVGSSSTAVFRLENHFQKYTIRQLVNAYFSEYWQSNRLQTVSPACGCVEMRGVNMEALWRRVSFSCRPLLWYCRCSLHSFFYIYLYYCIASCYCSLFFFQLMHCTADMHCSLCEWRWRKALQFPIFVQRCAGVLLRAYVCVLYAWVVW